MKNSKNLVTYILVFVILAMIGLLFSFKNEVVVVRTPDISNNTTSDALLDQGPWMWQKVTYNDGNSVTANDPENFILAFEPSNRLSSTTDCNNLAGEYSVDGQNLSITNLASTMMYCDNSQESTYSQMLQDVSQYQIASDGTLELKLKTNGGVAVFTNY